MCGDLPIVVVNIDKMLMQNKHKFKKFKNNEDVYIYYVKNYILTNTNNLIQLNNYQNIISELIYFAIFLHYNKLLKLLFKIPIYINGHTIYEDAEFATRYKNGYASFLNHSILSLNNYALLLLFKQGVNFPMSQMDIDDIYLSFNDIKNRPELKRRMDVINILDLVLNMERIEWYIDEDDGCICNFNYYRFIEVDDDPKYERRHQRNEHIDAIKMTLNYIMY
jgi:hypothetical protein